MRILLLCEVYPSADNLYAMGFVHSRALEYRAAGHCVRVLSFSALQPYNFEGIEVVTRSTVGAEGDYDVALAHAPNVRHHFPFLTRFSSLPLGMFIHGHEMLVLNQYYPAPFDFDRSWKESASRLMRSLYDPIKLLSFKRFCKHAVARGRPLGFVFVSDWMRREAEVCNPWLSRGTWPAEVIPNAVNGAFLAKRYQRAAEPLADFVCIRPFDNPKYAVDEVIRWAQACPQGTFHIYGKGRYFEFHPPPPNVKVFQRFIMQPDIPALLDRYRAAVMPTRLDSQGVMMCEMASYGIPVITSDTEVTRQMLGGFSNVAFVRQETDVENVLRQVPPPLLGTEAVRRRFEAPLLAARELEFASRLCGMP